MHQRQIVIFLLIRWIVITTAIVLAAAILPGIHVESLAAAIIAANVVLRSYSALPTIAP